jgi:hypothetical protein
MTDYDSFYSLEFGSTSSQIFPCAMSKVICTLFATRVDIILRFLRLDVFVYNVYIIDQFPTMIFLDFIEQYSIIVFFNKVL